MTTKVKNIVLVVLMGAFLLGMSLWCWCKEADDFSDSERRALAAFPELTWEELSSGQFMSDFETYTQDQFPLREKFRTLKALSSLYLLQQKENNGLYLADGHVSKLEYPLHQPMLDHAAERFAFVYDTYLAQSGAQVYLSVLPDKNYFLAEDNGYLALDYDAIAAGMREKLPYMDYIDVTPLLSIEDYYYTDSHWRQENILDVADYLLQEMGGAPSDAVYTEHVLDVPFYGVYTGQSALPLAPDTIRYLTSDAIDACVVTSYDTGMPVAKPVYNMEKAAGKDAYEFFLSGADALMTVENPNAKTDEELIIFRDSFASSLTPLLVEQYAKITLVDLRYIQSAMLGSFIDFTDQDVLFLYSVTLLNNSLAIR